MKIASLRSAGGASAFSELGKKEMPNRMFRACERDQRSARWIGGRFLKKATEKLPTKQSPTNLQIKI